MLIRNTFYNLLGLGLPLLVAIGSIPVLIHSLGDARFGVLTLIWAVVSYFGLFDLGLGRALTQQLSVFIAEHRDEDIPALVYTSLLLLGALGAAAGLIMWSGATFGAQQISFTGDRDEIVSSIQVMAIGMPFIVLTSGLRGILEAKSQFVIINLIRVPMGVFTFVGPLAVVLWYRNDLVSVTVALTAGRMIATLVHAYYVARTLPGIVQAGRYRASLVKTLLATGGWMTVSNVISPLMGYLDRFLIGVTISASAVAYYVTPNEIITKLWIIPSAFTAVLLPKFASNIASKNPDSAVLFKQAVSLLFLAIYPLALFCALFAHEILALWISPTFADKGYIPMQIFAFGILVNSVAHIPYVLIQSAGKAKVTAMIHVAEFVPFAIILWIFTSHLGILGAALAWLLRMLTDSAFMFAQAREVIERKSQQYLKLLLLGGLVVPPFFCGALLTPIVKIAVFLLSFAAVLFYQWCFFTTIAERDWLKGKLSWPSTQNKS